MTSWHRFTKFMRRKLQAPTLPSTAYNVALYVTHLAKSKLRSTTIRSHLSAIAFYHKINGFPNPSSSFLINKLLSSYNKRDGPSLVRKPITAHVLHRLLSALDSSGYSRRDRKLYRAVFTIMYHAALRASEVCVSSQASHTLQRSQMELISSTSGDAVKIHFRSYKHSKGHPCPLVVYPSGKTGCAVRAYKSYLGRSHLDDGPAFQVGNDTPLTRPLLAKLLHSLLKLINLNPAHYNTHSFRIGKATDMAKQGFSYSQIAMLGRWKSNAFLKYIKPTVVHGTR